MFRSTSVAFRTISLLILLLAIVIPHQLTEAADKGFSHQTELSKAGEDTEKLMELVLECEKRMLFEQRLQTLELILKLDPEHTEANRFMGKRKYKDEWLPILEAYRAEVKDKHAEGLDYHGDKWIDAKKAASLRKRLHSRLDQKWNFTHYLSSKHTHVFSNMELARAMYSRDLYESCHNAYVRFHAPIKAKALRRPLVVFMVDDLPTYTQLTGKNASFAGLFSQYKKKMFVYSCEKSPGVRTPEMAQAFMEMLSVHEMLHGIDHFTNSRQWRGPASPTGETRAWIREGRADMFGYGILGGRVVPGALSIQPYDGRLRSLKKHIDSGASNLESALKQNMSYNSQEWVRKGEYALTWSFTLFLIHADQGKYRNRFLKYLKLQPKANKVVHFEKVVAPLSKLVPEYMAYSKERLLPIANDTSWKKDLKKKKKKK